jgi:hypothetical protein
MGEEQAPSYATRRGGIVLQRRLWRLGYSLLYSELGLGAAAVVVGGFQARPMLFYLGLLLAALAAVALALVALIGPGGP